MTPYYFLASLFVFALAYRQLMRKPLARCVDRHLAEAQHEHARWVSICLEFTKAGCDAEARIAAEQVVVLRTEINFYRRWLRNLGGRQNENAHS